jgi:hypothetical protein
MSPSIPLLTQTPSAPVTPIDDLRSHLDGRIDNLTQQMEAFMTSFREASPSSRSAQALTPGTTTVHSPAVTVSTPTLLLPSSSPAVTAALLLPSPMTLPVDPLCSPIVPSGALLRPTLEPTPELQGPPPPVARSNAELIGDHPDPGDHPVDPVRLSYTPQGHSHRRRTVRTNEAFEFKSTAKSSDAARHLHSSQRRDELYVSGYYWASPSPVLAQHCVAWLDPNLDGPYAGKHDRIAKLSFTLADDNLAGFMKFYTALRAGLNACGFNPHLLPLLPRIRHDVDLVLTPIVASSTLVIGSGDNPAYLRTPNITHWQRAHDSLGMTLYALLLDSIKASARHAYQALHNALQLGESNGFGVIHEIIRMHHPSIANSLAPSYSTIYARPPSMATPGRDGTYELSHATYLAHFRDWETQLRYYPEFTHFRPTQLTIQFIHGLLRELRPHILHLENLLLRHQAKHRFQLLEPKLPPDFDSYELHEVLTAAVRSLDMAGRSGQLVAGRSGQLKHGPTIGSILQTHTETDMDDTEYMDYFAHFCDTDLGTDGESFDVCVSAIQRFQQSRQQGGRPGRGRSTSAPTACSYAPCSRIHPPDQCCVCRAAHPVHKCWHVNGLPETVQSTANNFRKLLKAQEGPWQQSTSAITKVSFDASCANPHSSSLQNATEDAIETVRTDGIEPYRSPYIKKILQDRQSRIVTAIDFIDLEGTAVALPADGPPLPDELIAGILDHSTDDAIKTAYFHVDTGATCVVTDQVAELHCPIPTQATCGTAAKGPRTTINAMGWLVLDLVTDKGVNLPFEFPKATEIQQFQRRSLSCHALKDLGYEVQHALLASGNLLRVRQIGTTTWHAIPLVTHGRSDYVKVNLHLPAVEGISTFQPTRALTAQSVARLDMVNKYKSTTDAYALVMLIHLRYGCASGTVLAALLKTLKINVAIPDDFLCPICMSEKTVSLSRGRIQPLLFLPLGARLQMDFGFYKIPSIRGFTCFLVVVESRSSNRWVYLRRSKHPPIELCLWFIRMTRRVLGFSVTMVRTDGGGELWGSKDFRRRLFEEAHVIVEPTGGENSAANGKAERAIGVLGVQAQVLLYGAGLDPVFWCFALLHAATLSNIKPRHDGRVSSHVELYITPPNLTSLRIFGSTIYRVDRRMTRRRPESATKKGIWLGLHGTASICVYMDIVTKRFGYAHHYIVDELELDHLPGDRSPAARLMAGHPLPANIEAQVKEDLVTLEPDISPWLTDSLVNYHIDGIPASRMFGFMLDLHHGYGRLKVASIIPGSFVYMSLKDKHVEGLYLLAINGIELRGITDMTSILDDIFDRPEPLIHTVLTGFTFLFGKLDPSDTDDDTLSSEEHYHAVSRSVFSLCLEALADPASEDASLSNDLTCLFLDMEVVDPDFIAEIWSILQSATDPQCPRSFSAALKEPVHRGKWVAAFYKHLDSCYALGTYGSPTIPPGEATVLPAVVVLKLVLNQLKQAAAHKIRVCVHGGLQIQGKDYEESYAHTILSQSLKIIIAVGCCLGWSFYHFDIHNAFQSTPDDGDIHGNRSWLQISPLWLEYIRERKPEWWPKIETLLTKHTVHELAVEMFKFVQGRVDASRKWGEHVEEVIFKELGLIPNRADPAVYSGIFQGHPLILGRATDDFLCACQHEATYLAVVAVFETHWKVHALGIVDTFFGLHFVSSDDCVTIDQTGKAETVIEAVFGPGWKTQPPSTSCSIPMKTGTAYAESLARALPLDPEASAKVVVEFGFEFRSILMSCMHLALWTRLDIFTTCVQLAQYQNHPSHIHFAAVKQMVGYIRLHPDLPLTFDRRRFIEANQQHSVHQLGCFDINLAQLDSSQFHLPGPESYHVASVQLLQADHAAYDLSVDAMHPQDPLERIKVVPPYHSAKEQSATASAPAKVDFVPSTPKDISFGPDSQAPYTESFVDANLPGGIFEKTPYLGFAVSMSGTCVFPFCRKCDTATENTTEAEMTAGNHLGKALRWLHLLMDDLGLAFDGPIPVAEDNAATRIIAHTGKLTRNVRHIALRTLSLQGLVRERIAMFRAIGSANNRADHFTKALPLPALRDHCCDLMGLRFLTALHAAAVARALLSTD